ncbi:MAG: hypothetical protein ACYTGN_17595, partial [Planctomycetota bacterium]|jgi:hypothetical protein
MPAGNRFRHQEYRADRPGVPVHFLRPEPGAPAAGEAYRAAGVAAIYLVHGTFVGTDASGLIGELSRFAPGAGARLRRWWKRTVDRVAGDAANYTEEYARALEAAVGIPVRLFLWSSENHHLGRSRAAVRLLDELAGIGDGRVLLWGHSHGGNVLALASNLLGGDPASRREFLRAARINIREPAWPRATLDMVTFGTPVRYGWDTNGYGKLLHVIHHRPVPGLPDYQARFPPDPREVAAGEGGDHVQQFGIAGTNFPPSIFQWRSWRADRRLNGLLQPGLRARDLLARLKRGVRVPDEGETLLVDYGEPEPGIREHVAGHAVYTYQRWLPFHAGEVARRLYRSDRE